MMKREDVERLAARLDKLSPRYGNRDDAETAAALRALLAERDAAFAAGQESMRERAAVKLAVGMHVPYPMLAEDIRTLPLKDRP